MMITKEEILEEIRKTANENGGTPLGIASFEKETGLKPNSLIVPYTNEFLFEKLIILIRELNKIPTYREINLKHRSDKEFPSADVYYRLGNTVEQVSKLLEYSKLNKYSDVTKLCHDYLEKKTQSTLEDKSLPQPEIGFVYLVKSGKYFKIGRTNNMDRRHQEITIILPEGLILIHEIKTDDPSGIENYWHRRFESKRKNGEWFDLSILFCENSRKKERRLSRLF